MPTTHNWWRAWAPFWEALEDRHLSLYTTGEIEEHIKSPVLVIGAGQGLIVEYLMSKGHRVDGIDLEPRMIEWAQKRRGLRLIEADANNLPFQNGVYKTVIVASGVVDYQRKTTDIGAIVAEAMRVLDRGGTLLTAFYQIAPKIEKIYKKIGVIIGDTFYLRRIFDISHHVEQNPLSCVKLVQAWTGRNYLSTFAYWTKLGLTLPRELKEENIRIQGILQRAAEHQISSESLFNSIPDQIPYRRQRDVAQVFKRLKLTHFDLHRSDDCIVVVHRKSSPSNGDDSSLDSRATAIPPQSVTGPWLIETRNLTKKYKGSSIPAVDRLSLGIEPGIVFGILGPNGAGKTTTLMMLCGLIKPDSGEIHFAETLSEKQNQKNMIGYVPQELALYPKLSGRDNLIFFGRIYNIRGPILRERIELLLEMTGLVDRADDLVGTYSTGMKRRLNLAVGLIQRPEIVLMDEPTVGIDPQSRNRIYDAIAELKEDGVTMLYTTHYMDEASHLCDRIAIIDKGTVLLTGSPQEIVERHGTCILNYETSGQPQDLITRVLELDGVVGAIFKGNTFSVTAKKQSRRIKQLELVEDRARKLSIDLNLKNVIEPNLESLFLDLTGRQLRDNFDDGD